MVGSNMFLYEPVTCSAASVIPCTYNNTGVKTNFDLIHSIPSSVSQNNSQCTNIKNTCLYNSLIYLIFDTESGERNQKTKIVHNTQNSSYCDVKYHKKLSNQGTPCTLKNSFTNSTDPHHTQSHQDDHSTLTLCGKDI